MKWEILTTEEQFLNLIKSGSVFAVFKHSTRCSISSMAKSRLEREWNLDIPVYYLDLIQFRTLSNLIAGYSGVEHQSPQLIVFQGGTAVYNASHNTIQVNTLKEELIF
ncbi:MAG: bacillithiol system redox-active protein YtxJ [Sphingobacteriales bacterium]|nr:bacillithiol system redox-active protein YtxJ [Sphingobacteriales bacterium]